MAQFKPNALATFIVVSLMIFTGGASVFEYMGEDKKTTYLLWKMIFTVAAAVVALIQGVIIARNQQNFTDGARQGHQDMQNSWKEVSRRLESAFNSSLEMSTLNGARKTEAARMTVDRLMSTFAQVVSSIFPEINKAHLTVTLGIPNTAGDKMVIVELLHEANGRRRGNIYDLPTALQQCNSMSLAYKGGEPIYTADAWAIPALRNKSYRSILSIPITAPNRNVLAVLNVDTAQPDAFGPRDPNNAALASVLALSLPIQRAIAQSLLTSSVYSEFRS